MSIFHFDCQTQLLTVDRGWCLYAFKNPRRFFWRTKPSSDCGIRNKFIENARRSKFIQTLLKKCFSWFSLQHQIVLFAIEFCLRASRKMANYFQTFSCQSCVDLSLQQVGLLLFIFSLMKQIISKYVSRSSRLTGHILCKHATEPICIHIQLQRVQFVIFFLLDASRF